MDLTVASNQVKKRNFVTFLGSTNKMAGRIIVLPGSHVFKLDLQKDSKLNL